MVLSFVTLHITQCRAFGLAISDVIIKYPIHSNNVNNVRHCITKPYLWPNNFGPFQPIFFVIVLFESQSKTLFRVLFASLYLQIHIFYFGILEYPNFTQEFRPEIQLEILKQCDVNILALGKRRKSILKVKSVNHPFMYRVRTRYPEKLKINISSPPYSNETFYTKVFHSY
jgi:hypothetical protein